MYIFKGAKNGSIVSYTTTSGATSGLARYYSPVLGQTGPYCDFQFYYYKVDRGVNVIQFQLFLINSNGVAERLWKKDTNSDNNNWKNIAISLHNRKPGFKLYLEAVQTNQDPLYKPTLGIDTTSFINCGLNSSVPCNSGNVFKCNNQNCIPNNLVCACLFINYLKLFFLIQIKIYFKGLRFFGRLWRFERRE